MKILRYLVDFQREKNRAKAIKENPEKQPKSIRFGVSSIFASILGVAFSFLLVFGIKWLMSGNLWLIIAGFVIGLMGLAGVISGIGKAIESWAFQLYINKRPITWIALVLWILAIVAVVVITVLFM